MHTLLSKLVTLSVEKQKCRSRQIFEVANDFCPKSPNVPEKYSKENDLQKNDCIYFHVGRIFSNQSTSSTIFAQIISKLAQISPTLPEKN